MAEVMNVVGEVEGPHCLMVDDLIDTAGTLVKGAEALLEQGAQSVSACATHAVLSGPAVERIEESPLKEVIFTNSIPLPEEAKAVAQDQVVCRWRRCWPGRFSRFTKRLRSVFCLCRKLL